MPPVPRIGTMFAGYRVEGLLGRGGMGVVYRAEHPRLGAPVALKLMDPELGADELFRERFVREARAAAQIRHPNIIPIYDADEWNGDLYIAMRFIEGEDLRSLLRKQAPLSVEQTYAIGIQIASALDAAHRGGLVHRDLKPANILIEPGQDPGSGPMAYLADLGLTKHLESRIGVTPTGELMGTIDYIAPEQISGGRVDGQGDIYSLACVLFECLTGQPPYVRENQAAVLWAHLYDEIPRATSINPSLPRAVDDALAQGMAKSPDDRFSTARELVEALQVPRQDTTTAVGRTPTETRSTPDSLPAPQTAADSHKNRRGLALALAAVVGLVLGAGAAAGIAMLVADEGTSSPPATSEGRSLASTTTERKTAAFTPFDEQLLHYVPDELRSSCRHARPIASEFDATVSCRPGGPVSSVTYSHARSGFVLFDFFMAGMAKIGLPDVLTPTGLCSSGEIPSVNTTVAAGLSGRSESLGEKIPQDERLGLVRCWQRGGRARIEWTTREVGVYAAATGNDLGSLYEWWQRHAGPEP